MLRLNIGKRLFIGFLALIFLEAMIAGFGIINIRKLSSLNQRSIDLIVPMEVVYELLLSFQDSVSSVKSYLTHGNILEKEVFKIKADAVRKYIAKAREVFPKKAAPEFIQISDNYFQRILKMADNIFQIEKPVGSIEGAMLMEEMSAFMGRATEALEEYHEEYVDKQLEVIKEEGLKIVQASNALFSAFSLLGLALSVALAYLLTRRVRRPLVFIEIACKKLARGELDKKIELDTHDEFEELANTFNRMADDLTQKEQALKEINAQLSNLNKTLEQKVSERTTELQSAKNDLEKRVAELERIHRVTIDRELRIKELKQEIQELKLKGKEGT